MERQPDVPNPILNSEKLPESVERVANTIYNSLAHDYGHDFEAVTVTGHSVLFTIDEDNPLSLTNFTSIADESSVPAVNISFNEKDQTILVAPMRN